MEKFNKFLLELGKGFEEIVSVELIKDLFK
jgi:hypothetical protein